MATDHAAAGAAAQAPTATEYIQHHLTQIASQHQDKIIEKTNNNKDTLCWSVAIGKNDNTLMWLAARRATSGVPGRFQSLVEIVVEMVEDQSKAIVHGDRRFIAPLALTVFVWVLLMNAMDFLPVDMFDRLFKAIGLGGVIHFHRAVPTADLNGTLGMALGVLALMLFYNVKIKGVGGFVHELFCAPFG